MLLYGTLILCAMTVGVIVYRYDLYDREPILILVLAAALGMGAMSLAGQAEAFWLVRAGEDAAWNRWIVAALAGTHEELAKFLVVLAIALLFPRIFNDPMDGLVYGSFAGLGAAIDESITAVRDLGPGEGLPASEVVRVLGHLVMGGIGGFGLGFMRRRRWWPGAAAASFTAAAGLHFAWDVVAVPANDAGVMSPGQRLGASAVMAAGLIAFAGMVSIGSRYSREAFGGERKALWGWPFIRAAMPRSSDAGEM